MLHILLRFMLFFTNNTRAPAAFLILTLIIIFIEGKATINDKNLIGRVDRARPPRSRPSNFSFQARAPAAGRSGWRHATSRKPHITAQAKKRRNDV
jgi:hypothetical protein